MSLLSAIGKSIERCVHKHLYNFVLDHRLITPFQSGFTKNDSTTNQLIYMYLYHTFCEAIDNGREVRVVFCDISKAFDRVWHRGLLHKLSSVGFKGTVLRWLSSYLSERRQRVVLNGQASEWAVVEAGVPQGSILGPLLFLLYINDIVNEIRSNIRLFADDTSLYIIVDTPDNAAEIINTDLHSIYRWLEEWLVDFNASKTFTMTVSRKLNPPLHPPLFFNATRIQETNCHKHLGINLSKDCSWSEHIEYITKIAWQRLNMLRLLKFKLKRSSLEKIYNSFVRPLMEYRDSVWDNCNNDESNKLESIHTEAARIITGATKLCSIDRLFKDLDWETLQNRRRKHRLLLFYKMFHRLTPDFLSELLPSLVHQNNSYSLRNANDIQTLHARTNLFFSSFLPATIRDWNSLPLNIRHNDSISTFKKYLNSNKNPPPSYYNAGSRIGQIVHTRLRLECSSLNAHLYSKNIVDSPLCVCGDIENSTHFFFNCSRYTVIRRNILAELVHQCTLKDFLYGKEGASTTENERLFLKVQSYIIQTKRFVN